MRLLGLAILLRLAPTMAPGAEAPDACLEIDFIHGAIGPNVRCDGEVRVEHGRLAALHPVFFDRDDEMTDQGWRLATEGTPEATAGRNLVCMSLKPKGIQVDIEGGDNPRLHVSSSIGSFRAWLSEIPLEGEAAFLGGKVTVRRIPPAARLTTDAAEDDFASIDVAPNGDVLAVWQSWAGEEDSILIARRAADGWGKPEPVLAMSGDVLGPQILCDDQGAWVVWSEQRRRGWELYGRRLTPSGWLPEVRLTTREGADFGQRLVLGPDGETWAAWQAATPDGFDILLGRVTTLGMRDTVTVAGAPHSDWAPAVACDGGGIWVGWDSYRGPERSYDVMFRRYEDGRLGPEMAAAATPEYEAHAALACDGRGRLWIGYASGGENWGRHPRPHIRLHEKRALHVVCYDGDRFLEPSTPFGTGFDPRFEPMCELPTLVADKDGLWVVFRHLNDIKEYFPNNAARPWGQVRCSWNVYATHYADGRWSTPQELPHSNGRNDAPAGAALDAAGNLRVGYAADGRYRWRAEEPVNHNVFVAAVPRPDVGRSGLEVAAIAGPEAVALPSAVLVRNAAMTRDGAYTLVYGDTHRHTDISRCGMNYDGSLMDTYRYAIDATGIDFLAISDHDQDILRHRYGRPEWPLPSYAWWRSGKYADLMQNGDRFVAFHAYEHGGSMRARGGHKNVIYARRNGPCLEDDAPAALFAALSGFEATAIPHQLADGGSATDWDEWDPEWERVAEIFQARGSYEYIDAPRQAQINTPGQTIWDAYDQGVNIGIIASSDHGQTHSAYAGVYVREVSRGGILEGLKAKRAFGGTEKMVLDLRIGDALMGQKVEADAAPRLKAAVHALAPLQRVDIIKDGEFVYNVDPDGADCAFEWEDLRSEPGDESYYYLRAIQEDNEIAWSSPIWVARQA